jgi:hypothetical protein
MMMLMSRGKLTRFFTTLSESVGRYFPTKQAARFVLILGLGLFIDYMRELARPCQFLTTLQDFPFCPLVMHLYAEHTGLTFWNYAWSPRSFFFIVLAAAVTAFWAARDARLRN